MPVPCMPGQRATCGYPGHAGPIARLAGRTGVRRGRARVVRKREPGREPACALVDTDMIKVLTNRKPLSAADGCKFYVFYRLLWAFLYRLRQNLDIYAMRANSQS